MGHIFGPKFLRVRTPKTSDGKTLEYEDGQPVYTETNLPLTAKRALDRENERTPIPYRHKIDIIDENAIPDAKTLVKGAGVSIEAKREALLKQLAELDNGGTVSEVDIPKEVAAPKIGKPAPVQQETKKLRPVSKHTADVEEL